MKSVLAYGTEIEKNRNLTIYRDKIAFVEISKLKNTGTRKSQCGYYGFCPDYAKHFPSDAKGNEKGKWMHLIKSHNFDVKLPVLQPGEEVEL